MVQRRPLPSSQGVLLDSAHLCPERGRGACTGDAAHMAWQGRGPQGALSPSLLRALWLSPESPPSPGLSCALSCSVDVMLGPAALTAFLLLTYHVTK